MHNHQTDTEGVFHNHSMSCTDGTVFSLLKQNFFRNVNIFHISGKVYSGPIVASQTRRKKVVSMAKGAYMMDSRRNTNAPLEFCNSTSAIPVCKFNDKSIARQMSDLENDLLQEDIYFQDPKSKFKGRNFLLWDTDT